MRINNHPAFGIGNLLLFRKHLCCVFQEYYTPTINICGSIHHLLFGIGKLIGWHLKEWTQCLDCHLQIFLIILKDVCKIIPFQIKCKCVCPFESLAALLKNLGGGLEVLNLNPRQTRGWLQSRHLFLRLNIKILIQFRWVVVIIISVVILERRC